MKYPAVFTELLLLCPTQQGLFIMLTFSLSKPNILLFKLYFFLVLYENEVLF